MYMQAVVFASFASADPARHRCISEEERAYIQALHPLISPDIP